MNSLCLSDGQTVSSASLLHSDLDKVIHVKIKAHPKRMGGSVDCIMIAVLQS